MLSEASLTRAAAQACESFIARLSIQNLLVSGQELRWVLLADTYRAHGLAKLRGKFIADLLPKLSKSMARFKSDPAWSELSTGVLTLLMEAAFKAKPYLKPACNCSPGHTSVWQCRSEKGSFLPNTVPMD